MRLIPQVVLGLVLLALPVTAGAQTQAAPRLVLTCAPCHGFDGSATIRPSRTWQVRIATISTASCLHFAAVSARIQR